MGAAFMRVESLTHCVVRQLPHVIRMILSLAVVSDSLPLVSVANADPGDTLRPLYDDLPLHLLPDRSSAIVRRLRMSDRLLEFRRADGWVRVATHGVIGWGWVPETEIALKSERPAHTKHPDSETRPQEDSDDKMADMGSDQFPLRLDIDGSPAMEIRGECRLVTLDHREVWWKFSDTTPMQYNLEAVAAACRVDKKDGFGRLRVLLMSEDNRIAWATTAAPYNWVHVRTRGPWGSQGASRGLGAIIVPPVRSVSPQGNAADLRR